MRFPRARDNRSAAAATDTPRRHRYWALAGLVPVAFYMASTVIYNAPHSPAQIRLASFVSGYMNPYFEQDWQLFGPTPGTSNDSLVIDAKVARSSRGCSAPPIDVEYSIDRMPRHQRLLPSKLPGVILGFQETFAQYAKLLNQIQHQPATGQPALRNELSSMYSSSFGELDRFLSVEARINYPGCEISAVKAILASTPIVPYSQRYQNPPPHEDLKPVLRTGWMPYIPGVAN